MKSSITIEEARSRLYELRHLLACSRGDYYKDLLREYALLKREVRDYGKKG